MTVTVLSTLIYCFSSCSKQNGEGGSMILSFQLGHQGRVVGNECSLAHTAGQISWDRNSCLANCRMCSDNHHVPRSSESQCLSTQDPVT